MARRGDDTNTERMPMSRQSSLLNPSTKKIEGTEQQANSVFNLRSKWLSNQRLSEFILWSTHIFRRQSQPPSMCTPLKLIDEVIFNRRIYCHDLLRMTRFQTIDPAQFAAYNSIECVIKFSCFLLQPFDSFQRRCCIQVNCSCGARSWTWYALFRVASVLVSIRPQLFSGLNLVRSDLWEKTSGSPSLSVHAGK
jgi:hypothetical protein